MEPVMKWKVSTSAYTTGELLFLGAWNVGGAYYDGATSKSEQFKYTATCKLPGIKDVLGHFNSIEEAKKATERAVAHWLSKLSSSV